MGGEEEDRAWISGWGSEKLEKDGFWNWVLIMKLEFAG